MQTATLSLALRKLDDHFSLLTTLFTQKAVKRLSDREGHTESSRNWFLTHMDTTIWNIFI